MNLQLFADAAALAKKAIQGKKIVYLYRLLKEATTTDAVHVAFTTENSTTISRDADSTATKDGSIRTPGEVEIEISTTAILAIGDEMIDKLKKALVSGDVVEVWEVNMAEKAETANKFAATYYQGYVTEYEKSSSAEDFVECSLTFGITGSGVDGEATVSELQQEMIAAYGFADTQKTGA